MHEFDVAVAKQRVDAAGMATAGRDIQRQAVPEVIGLVAVRNAAAAVDVAVVGPAHVVVHGVARSAVEPAAAAGLLEPEPRAVALAGIVGQLRSGKEVVVSLGQHEAVGLAYAVPDIRSAFRFHRLADAHRLAESVGNLGKARGRVFVEDAGDRHAAGIAAGERVGRAGAERIVVDGAFALQLFLAIAGAQEIGDRLVQGGRVVRILGALVEVDLPVRACWLPETEGDGHRRKSTAL